MALPDAANCPEAQLCTPKRRREYEEVRRPVKTFLYGILFGAAGMYLYVTQGDLVDATLGDMLSWRNSAKTSVYGYGGHPKPQQ